MRLAERVAEVKNSIETMESNISQLKASLLTIAEEVDTYRMEEISSLQSSAPWRTSNSEPRER